MDILNLGILKSLRFPVAPVEEQHAMIATFEMIDETIEELNRTMKVTLTQLEELERSVLANAFAR